MGLKKAIKDTVEYAANFKSQINKKEIEERLISKKIFTKKEMEKRLKSFEDKNKKNNWYKKKLNKAAAAAKKMENNFEDILFLGVSGSVASGHPKKNDDIDFLIITRANKLWKTRMELRWWVFKNQIPHRKYGRREKRDEFCFNLWLDEDHLKLPENKRNLRNSVDLILLKPLINKNNTYEKILEANGWAKKWVATPYFNKIQDLRYEMLDEKIKRMDFNKFINCLYFWPQYWYMRKKIKKETIGLYQAFFHR